MADFQISLLDTNNSVALTASSGTLTIGDYSNYFTSTESGHTDTEFSNYKKITVTEPDGTTYTYSTLGDGDELINPPSTYVSSPINNTYSYTDDGLYTVKIEAVPTWGAAFTYQQYDCTYYDGSLYQASQTTTNNVPDVSTTYWTLITSDELSDKYRIFEWTPILDEGRECWADKIYIANLALNAKCEVAEICIDQDFRKAIRLDNLIQGIEVVNNLRDWSQVEDLLTEFTNICDCPAAFTSSTETVGYMTSSSVTNSAKLLLADEQYKLAVSDLFGVSTSTEEDLFKMKNQLMILRVLEWDDSNQYLSYTQRKFLESRIQAPSKSYTYLT